VSRTRLVLGGFICFILLAPLVLPEFHVTLLNYIGLYSIVALGLVLLTGVGGLTSFGQAAFVGLGAYTTAYLSTAYGWSPWLTLPVGLVFTFAVSLFLGLISLRLSGHYLPLGTIAWGISLYFLFGNMEFLGGYTGISNVPAINFLGLALDTGRRLNYLIWILALLALLAMHNLLDSRSGRAIRALKGGGLMAESFGVDTARMKIIIFVHAALLASLSGWLYAHLLQFVNPTPFSINAGIEYLFMAVVGGAASVWGAVVGAGILTILKQWLQDLLPKLLGQSGNFEMIVFGILLVLLLQRAREGIMPLAVRYFPAPRKRLPEGVQALQQRVRPAAGEALLEVKMARKTFGGLLAVNDLSFAMLSGEILGLIGPNGAGKSTVFNLVTGILPLTGGEVHFRGERIDILSARAIVPRGLARTFQQVRLLPTMSVLENVAIGAHLRGSKGVISAALHLERAEEAMLLAEAARQLERVGLGASMHEQAGSLALGQQRILEIARALCADPVLLLLDEPAAGLRHQEKRALAEQLRKLRSEGMSILLVEHDMDFVMKLVDRLVVMDFGEKLAEGLPQEIQTNPLVLEAYLGSVK
jgi:ABC-type branched-subunit amino acid transport system ATPase component/ABC-type branched-subunit amino acid transport system permease subunit